MYSIECFYESKPDQNTRTLLIWASKASVSTNHCPSSLCFSDQWLAITFFVSSCCSLLPLFCYYDFIFFLQSLLRTTYICWVLQIVYHEEEDSFTLQVSLGKRGTERWQQGGRPPPQGACIFIDCWGLCQLHQNAIQALLVENTLVSPPCLFRLRLLSVIHP